MRLCMATSVGAWYQEKGAGAPGNRVADGLSCCVGAGDRMMVLHESSRCLERIRPEVSQLVGLDPLSRIKPFFHGGYILNTLHVRYLHYTS